MIKELSIPLLVIDCRDELFILIFAATFQNFFNL